MTYLLIIAYMLSYCITWWYMAKTYKDAFGEYEAKQSAVLISVLSLMSFVTILAAGLIFWLFDIKKQTKDK